MLPSILVSGVCSVSADVSFGHVKRTRVGSMCWCAFNLDVRGVQCVSWCCLRSCQDNKSGKYVLMCLQSWCQGCTVCQLMLPAVMSRQQKWEVCVDVAFNLGVRSVQCVCWCCLQSCQDNKRKKYVSMFPSISVSGVCSVSADVAFSYVNKSGQCDFYFILWLLFEKNYNSLLR